ncbi:MAG: HAMP domain-containing sensor histidine kinase, partial [Flammeovirgaceae bacterium]|nr:HAMP domain-containing sensor histidine kinase [Flammeovirgaceae bacterium]
LKLEELNREKDGLIGVVAHDLKAPLNRTQALVKMLGLEGTLNEIQKKYIEMIDIEIENARKLIRDLLDTSALEHHGSKISVTEFDIGLLCRELVEFYQTPAREKNIKIHFIQSYSDENNSPLVMKSDRDFIRRILDNLLSNAVKFSPPQKNVYLSLSLENQHVVIRVKDEGVGFTEEDKAKMFKKFQRLSAKPTGGESSTGLGLSIIKSLVEKLNGEITLESEWQKGAEFIVKIPLVYQ